MENRRYIWGFGSSFSSKPVVRDYTPLILTIVGVCRAGEKSSSALLSGPGFWISTASRGIIYLSDRIRGGDGDVDWGRLYVYDGPPRARTGPTRLPCRQVCFVMSVLHVRLSLVHVTTLLFRASVHLLPGHKYCA